MKNEKIEISNVKYSVLYGSNRERIEVEVFHSSDFDGIAIEIKYINRNISVYLAHEIIKLENISPIYFIEQALKNSGEKIK